MNHPELDRLLRLIEEHIDPARNAEIDARARRALRCEPTDRPPLLIQLAFNKGNPLPPPWNTFRYHPYRRTFTDPAAMMQNHLLDRVVTGILLQDDSPLAIRNNHGTIQTASFLGGRWEQRDDEFPWIWKFDRPQDVEAAAARPLDPNAGLLPQSIATLKFYRQTLAAYPRCRQAIQISLPDLQGPVDTAEQLWGSDIFYAFADSADLLHRLMARVVDAQAFLAAEFRKLALDRLDPFANTQHGCQTPGRLLIRNDTSILLSRTMYEEHVRPHDTRLLQLIGGGSIHFCGNGAHLVDSFLQIPHLRGLDFGQPEMMDIPPIYTRCRDRGIPCIRLSPPREDLLTGKARRDFPTACSLLYMTSDYTDALAVARRWREHGD
jgi:hypothetical protein